MRYACLCMQGAFMTFLSRATALSDLKMEVRISAVAAV